MAVSRCGPFDHPAEDYYPDNNPAATRTVPTDVTYEDVRPVAPYTSASVLESAQSKVVHLNITHERKAPVDASKEFAAAIPLEEKLARLEQVVAELTTEIQLRGGIVGAGRKAEDRILAVAHTLRSLAEHPPQRQFN